MTMAFLGLTVGFLELLLILLVFLVLFGGALAGFVAWVSGRKRNGR